MNIQRQLNRQRNHFETQIFLVQVSSGENCTQGNEHQTKGNPSFAFITLGYLLNCNCNTPAISVHLNLFHQAYIYPSVCISRAVLFCYFHSILVNRCVNKQVSSWESLLLHSIAGKEGQTVLPMMPIQKNILGKSHMGTKACPLLGMAGLSQQSNPLHKSAFPLPFESLAVIKQPELPRNCMLLEA